MRERLLDLARKKPRFGYRRLHILLGGGERVNHKRVFRVYREAGLAVRRKARKRLVREGSPRRALTAANQEWAVDFVHDAMASGRAIRVLSVVDECTRECLALEVDTSFASRRVTRALEAILEEREKAADDSLRQRTGIQQPAFSGLVHRAGNRAGAYSAGQAAAERVRGKLQREVAGRMLERKLVRESVGRAAEGVQ